MHFPFMVQRAFPAAGFIRVPAFRNSKTAVTHLNSLFLLSGPKNLLQLLEAL